MEGHYVTIKVQSKTNDAVGYVERFFCAATDPQYVKYLYHKYTNENYEDVVNAEDSHTMHTNGEWPQVQRLLDIEPADELPEDGTLPLDYI